MSTNVLSSRYGPAFALAAVLLPACHPGRRDIPQGGAPMMIAAAVGPVPGPKMAVPEQQNPFHGDRSAISEGRTLFDQYNCSGCHGPYGGGAMGPSLRDSVWLYGDTEAQIFDSISEGRNNGMPAWGTKVPEQQMWKIVAYLKTLRTPQEPEAPDQSLPREPIP
jgi:cytochrome c oxidase cbb3-type subunit 3